MNVVKIDVWFELDGQWLYSRDGHARIFYGKLAAIHAWRKATGCGLKEAKDFVEHCHAIEQPVAVQLTAEQLGMFVALIGQVHHDEGLDGFERFMGITPLSARVLETVEFDFTGAGE